MVWKIESGFEIFDKKVVWENFQTTICKIQTTDKIKKNPTWWFGRKSDVWRSDGLDLCYHTKSVLVQTTMVRQYFCDAERRREKGSDGDGARSGSEVYPVNTIKMRWGVARRPDAEPYNDSDDAQ